MDFFGKRLYTCSFSGHRTAKLPWGSNEADARCIALKTRLEDEILHAAKRGYMHFICGGAIGCDFYFAEAVLALRVLRPDFTLEIAVPFSGQAERWDDDSRRRYDAMLRAADDVTVLAQTYTNGCMMKRNKYMVDNSSLLIAVFNGQSGGTHATLDYARAGGLELVTLRP